MLSTLDIDETAMIVDVLFRFAANEKIVLHHMSQHSILLW